VLVIEHFFWRAALENGQPTAVFTDLQEPFYESRLIPLLAETLQPFGDGPVDGLGPCLAGCSGKLLGAAVSTFVLYVQAHSKLTR
jgi:hypothetical protein